MNNISIGVDVISHRKIILFFHKKKYKRFLTKKEQEEVKTRRGKEVINYIAGRWAAKEAIYKAISSYCKTNMISIEILNDKDGKPYCSNIKNINISISHTKNYSIAFCIFFIK